MTRKQVDDNLLACENVVGKISNGQRLRPGGLDEG